MTKEFRDDPTFTPWGPFISERYVNESISQGDVVVASIVWALTLINATIAIYIAYGQTRSSRAPLKSVYIWMIWLELIVSFIMGLECFLHLLKVIRPSFAFYFTILFWWCIQVQLLLQIIINRIRVIVTDRRHSRMIMISTAVFVTLINISVFNIWIPARLQISHRYHVVNEYWDRTEKVLYLLIDAVLNWYFLKTVKANLINNGLTKYNKLVKFNQKIVVLSLCMDVMIIAAMSIPNSFVYIQFHPLAYLVKLNIEMTMANLIKRIAISTSRRAGQSSIAQEFKSDSGLSQPTTGRSERRGSAYKLSTIVSYTAESTADRERTVSFAAMGTIKQTSEIIVQNEPNPFYESSIATKRERKSRRLEVTRQKSLESVTEGNDSVRSAKLPKRKGEDSDDEEALFGGKGIHAWGRHLR